MKGGLSLSGVLFVVFLVLKLTGNIDWSWWWVTSPIWLPFLIVFLLFLFSFSLFFIWSLILIFKGKTPSEINEKFDKIRTKMGGK